MRVLQRGTQAGEAEVLATLDNATIRVRLPVGQPAFGHQVLALTLVDLLCRLFPRIEVVVDQEAQADGALPPGATNLAQRFAATREHGVPQLGVEEPALTVAVGLPCEADLYVDADGWISYLGSQPSRLEHDSGNSIIPIGALLAAARGAAHAFTSVMAEHGVADEIPASLYSSALDFQTSPEPIANPDLPDAFVFDAVQIGAGSIGGAADYALAHVSGVSGKLTIVDPQELEFDNAFRAILASRGKAEAEMAKAVVASDALDHLGLEAHGFEGDVSEWLASRRREEPLPLVLSAVDSAPSRRAIQDCLPLDLVNAACNQTEAMVSVHRTGAGPCVCCLHMEDILNSREIKARRIERLTGIEYSAVVGLLQNHARLERNHLKFIERSNGWAEGALDDFLGSTLEELYDSKLRYGAINVETRGGGVVAVAAPWVTALAGFLLAAETLKYFGGDQFGSFRLGHAGNLATKLTENVYASPGHRILSSPPRWRGSECLCRSSRRRGLIVERYGLNEADFEL